MRKLAVTSFLVLGLTGCVMPTPPPPTATVDPMRTPMTMRDGVFVPVASAATTPATARVAAPPVTLAGPSLISSGTPTASAGQGGVVQTASFGPANANDPSVSHLLSALKEDFPPAPKPVDTAMFRADAEVHPPTALPPALRIVNTKRFSLGFELRDVASSALPGMELWGTTDSRTWKRYENVLFQPSACVVEVTEEGTHGFVLVAHGTQPRAGDAPMAWVLVDLSKPVVQLQGVEMSLTTSAPSLVVRWSAKDKNLGPRPITLCYAEQPDGPWTTLASNLPNTGRYEAAVPATLPGAIFLRVEAVDLAGNVGSARTEQTVHAKAPAAPAPAPVVKAPKPQPVPVREPVRPSVVVSSVEPD